MEDTELAVMVMSGPNDGQVIYLSQQQGHGTIEPDGTWSLVLGRREECDITILFDIQVSRHHAILSLAPNQTLTLTDNGSRNGTFIGRAQVQEAAPLERGELFRLGRTWLRVQPEMDKY